MAIVGVVLVNWNSGELTAACIRSLLIGSVAPQHIVVVDNNSHDRSVDMIRELEVPVSVIYNRANLGFAEACNIGAAYCLSREVDFVWLLNNDTEVDVNCLEELVNTFQCRQDVVVATGMIYYGWNRSKIWYGGAYTDKVLGIPRHVLNVNYCSDICEPVPFVSGCCMLIKADVIRENGLFDPSFFAYAEDFDWCYRNRKKGKYLINRRALLYHYVSENVKRNTGSNVSKFTRFLMVRNPIWVMKKGDKFGIRCRLVVYLLLCFRNTIGNILRGEIKEGLLLIRAIGCGLFQKRAYSYSGEFSKIVDLYKKRER